MTAALSKRTGSSTICPGRHPVGADRNRPAQPRATTPSGRPPRPTRKSRRSANCAARSPICGSTISPSAATAATARSCRAFRSRTGRNQPSNTRYHFRPERVAAGTDQAAARLRRRLRRLVAARIRDCRCAVRRSRHASRLPIRRPLSCVRQAGRRRPVRRHQGSPTGRSASCSSSASLASPTAWRRKVWRCGSAKRRSSPAICCARTARPTAHSGAGRTPPSTAPCCTVR